MIGECREADLKAVRLSAERSDSSPSASEAFASQKGSEISLAAGVCDITPARPRRKKIFLQRFPAIRIPFGKRQEACFVEQPVIYSSSRRARV